MKSFLYIILGLLLFLSIYKDKEVVYTPEFIYSEVYEDNLAVVEIDETTHFLAPLGEGNINSVHGKTRRIVGSGQIQSFCASFFQKQRLCDKVKFSLDEIKLKSILQTLFYKDTYQRLKLFLYILI